jgi:CheY-like chemotaxis protein
MRILVADDDFVSRQLIQRILEGFGYEVLTAENGQAA